MTTGNSRHAYVWLLVWLVFGLLAAYESGALAMHAGDSDVLALVYGACSAGAFLVLAIKSMGHARVAGLRELVLLCLIALVVSLWTIYGGNHAAWVTTAMFGAAYSVLCLVIGVVIMVIGWRRRHTRQVHVAEEHAQRDRRRRMEGIRAETAALASQSDKDALGAESDFTLPSRPKWEDS